jgi:hypothetical protein
MTIPFTWCRAELRCIEDLEDSGVMDWTVAAEDWFRDYQEEGYNIWYFQSPIYNHYIHGIAAVNKHDEVIDKFILTGIDYV